MHLYHYFEHKKGPFLSISDLPLEKAIEIHDKLVSEKKTFAAQRNEHYLSRRHELEQLVRTLFIEKGGKPERKTPHYFVVEECPWLMSWYEQTRYIKIPIQEFDKQTISFTYGDTFPTFSPNVTDDLEYRRKVYKYEEIIKIIDRYGLPQDNKDESIYAQPRYIEVQVWSDKPLQAYIRL